MANFKQLPLNSAQKHTPFTWLVCLIVLAGIFFFSYRETIANLISQETVVERANTSDEEESEEAAALKAAYAEDEAITVYVTRYGSKYHRKSCGYLSRSCRALSLKAARMQGYSRCSRCHPPIAKGDYSTTKSIKEANGGNSNGNTLTTSNKNRLLISSHTFGIILCLIFFGLPMVILFVAVIIMVRKNDLLRKRLTEEYGGLSKYDIACRCGMPIHLRVGEDGYPHYRYQDAKLKDP